MKDKNKDNKIVNMQKYIKRKQKASKNKTKTADESEAGVTKNDETMNLVSNIVNISSYLKTKDLKKEKDKELSAHDENNKIGKLIPFSQKKREVFQSESNQEFSDLKKEEASVIFIEDYLKTKDIRNGGFKRKEKIKEETYTTAYKSMGWIAASLLAVFASSIFYNQSNTGRSLANSSSKSVTVISQEEMENLSYKNDRQPQSVNNNLSATEYVKHLRQNQHLIKVKGEKPSSFENY